MFPNSSSSYGQSLLNGFLLHVILTGRSRTVFGIRFTNIVSVDCKVSTRPTVSCAVFVGIFLERNPQDASTNPVARAISWHLRQEISISCETLWSPERLRVAIVAVTSQS